MRNKTFRTQHPFAQVLFLIFTIILVWFPWVPFPYKMPLIVGVILIVVYVEYGTLKPLGFQRKPLFSTILWGSGLCIGVLLIGKYFKPVLEEFFNQKTDYSSYGALEGNFQLISELWAKAMISAAFGEEVFYRGYLFLILLKLMGNKTVSKILAILLTAILFGVVHNNQGVVGIINISVVGALFGTIYLLSKKNLLATILAHALVDTIGLYSLYEGFM